MKEYKLKNEISEYFNSIKFELDDNDENENYKNRIIKLNKIVLALLPHYIFIAFRTTSLEGVSSSRSVRGLKGNSQDYNSNLLQKEYIIDKLNKSFFVGILNQPSQINFDVPNICYLFNKDLEIQSEKTLDKIAEYVILNGVNRISNNLIANELNGLVAISEYIDSASIGLIQISKEGIELFSKIKEIIIEP